MKKLLTQAEVAELLQVQWRTVEDWRTRNYGPPFKKIGGAVRYKEEDGEAWVDGSGEKR